jgi:hypothetical protein
LRGNSNNFLKEKIVEIINEKKPQSVKQLTIMSKEILGQPEWEILEAVLELKSEGVIHLEDPPVEPGDHAAGDSDKTLWYKFTIAIGAISVIFVLVIPENLYPWAYVRNFFGVIFVLFLPGYAFLKALFPRLLSSEESSTDLETIERIALSVGLSVALASITGLLLYYSPLGLILPTIVVTFFAITCSFAIVGIVRASKKTKTLVL